MKQYIYRKLMYVDISKEILCCVIIEQTQISFVRVSLDSVMSPYPVTIN